jgi:hypothetical protein
MELLIQYFHPLLFVYDALRARAFLSLTLCVGDLKLRTLTRTEKVSRFCGEKNKLTHPQRIISKSERVHLLNFSVKNAAHTRSHPF